MSVTFHDWPSDPLNVVRVFAPGTHEDGSRQPASIRWYGNELPATSNDAKRMANALLDAAATCDRINAEAGIVA